MRRRMGLGFECVRCKSIVQAVVYRDDGRVCIACGGADAPRSALLHSVQIHKKDHGIKMTHAECMRIKTNTKQADGSYKPHWRYRGT